MSNIKYSGNIAKSRLKYMLLNDRVACTAETLSMIRKDIYRTVSNYMDIDENIELMFEQGDKPSSSYLNAKIHIKEIIR